MRVPVAPQRGQHLVLSVFQMWAILIREQWYLIAALRCISLMTWDVQHHFIGSFSISMSLVRCFLKTFGPFLNQITVELLLKFKSPLYILDNLLYQCVFESIRM